MAIIAVPDALAIRRVEWTFDRPAQVNRSKWTKRRQVVQQPGPSLWSATAELAVRIGTDEWLEAEAFLIDLEGQINTFRLEAAAAPQTDLPLKPVVDGAGQYGRVLRLRGGIAGAGLKRGQKMTVNEQMVSISAAFTFDADGRANVTFKPSLRLSPQDGAVVEMIRPTVLVALANSEVGWSEDLGGRFQARPIVVEEAF
ncbi:MULTISPECIES: hypothetical protein [Sphingomonas]|uniref:hypothetical protein n=1 Tax=Sphingomonas TaxID=13687 RepID=UPI00257B0115|nr:hypothetical protein [Sphingomonas sp.]MBQ1481343.1 hypothetical protein [Sphingomonas sp.]